MIKTVILDFLPNNIHVKTYFSLYELHTVTFGLEMQFQAKAEIT